MRSAAHCRPPLTSLSVCARLLQPIGSLSMQRLHQRISIIGAGVPGLVAAHALHQAGFTRVSIFESAPSFHASSPDVHKGGVLLAANGVRALDRLGLAGPLYALGNPIGTVRSISQAGHVLTKYHPPALLQMRAKNVPPQGKEERPPPLTSIAIHGKTLYDAISAALPSQIKVHFNKPLHSVAKRNPEDEHSELAVRLGADGTEEIETDLLIANDGVNSRVRSDFMNEQCQGAYKQLDAVYCSGVSPAHAMVTPDGTVQTLSDELVEVWGTGRKLAYTWIDVDRVYWLATIARKHAAGVEQDDDPALPPRLRKLFDSFSEPALSLLEGAPVPSLTVARADQFTPGSALHDGRMVLIGAAAHKSAIELWQNMAQGVEDAAVLATLLAQMDCPYALNHYSALRIPRAKFVVQAAHTELEQAIQGGRIMSAFRDMASSMIPPTVERESVKQLLAFDAVAEAEKAL